jgi:hypothetical protein
MALLTNTCFVRDLEGRWRELEPEAMAAAGGGVGPGKEVNEGRDERKGKGEERRGDLVAWMRDEEQPEISFGTFFESFWRHLLVAIEEEQQQDEEEVLVLRKFDEESGEGSGGWSRFQREKEDWQYRLS